MTTSLRMDEAATIASATEIVSAVARAGGEARLLGGIAIALRCPSAKAGGPLSRLYSDVDLVTTNASSERLASALVELGYEPASRFNAAHGHSRLMFDRADATHVDVFIRRFTMCHSLDLGGRLAEDDLTIPLVDLLLTKLQVAELNEKDVTDAAALLLDHELTADEGGINLQYLAAVLTRDWGWWRTVTDNLRSLTAHLQKRLDEQSMTVVASRIETVLTTVDEAPKSLRWRARAKAGTRLPWRDDPEESH